MRDLVRKYRMNKLTKSELEETRRQLESLSDNQLGHEIYDDWHEFEPAPGQENVHAEAEVYRRLSTMLIKPSIRRHRLTVLCSGCSGSSYSCFDGRVGIPVQSV